MNGALRISPATLAAVAATAAFLVSGGIWLGNLQTRVDEHTGLMAHTEADNRLDEVESDISVMKDDMKDMDSLLHSLSNEEERRHKEVMDRLRQMEWQPYLKEE